jgi:secondary thiamine-phosphate synthase enzyme
MIARLSVSTRSREQLVDVTREVADAVRDSGMKDGVATLFVPHTTAAITINENADPSVVADIVKGLGKLVPRAASYYRHSEGNSDSHIKASLIGPSVQVLVEGGRLVLGTWQGIYLCEFDGPRTRKLYVHLGAGA